MAGSHSSPSLCAALIPVVEEGSSSSKDESKGCCLDANGNE